MKKINKNFFVLSFLIVALLSFTMGVYADEVRQTITATLAKDININYDGEEYVPRDAVNNVVYPILYNGTTYLPIRAVATMFGKNVDWDGKTQTVILTSSDYVGTDEYKPETELNDNLRTANAFKLDSKMKGTVGEYNEALNLDDNYDYFQFSVSEPGIVYFTVEADFETGLVFELRDAYDEILADERISETGIIKFESPFEPGSNYFVSVRAEDKSAYKIENTFESLNNPSENNNDELSNARDIPFDTFVKGTFDGYAGKGYRDETDFYKFDEPLSGLTIELNHTGFDYIRVHLYNTYGELLESYDSEMGKLNVTYQGDPEWGKLGFMSLHGGYVDGYQVYNLKLTK